jgi:hypothetical protein
MGLLPEPNGPPFGGCAPCAGGDGGPPWPGQCPTGVIPGPEGQPGTPGAPAFGINAFTTTMGAGFTVPAPNTAVVIPVGTTAWMAVGQIIYIQSAGSYQVAGIQDATDVVGTCLNYDGDAAQGTLIAPYQPVVPAGQEGPPGETGSGVTSVGLSVPPGFVVSGSPVTSSGTLAVTTDPSTAQNLFLASPNGAAGAPTFRSIVAGDLPAVPAATGLTGQVSIANGGTGQNAAEAAFNALAPTTTEGDLIFSQGAPGNARLGIGSAGQVLTVVGGNPAWATPAFLVTTHRRATMSPDVMQATDSIIGIDLAGAFAETLVAAPADGRLVTIKDESGAANSNNITIYAGAGDTIQGSASNVISTAYGYRTLYYNASAKIWYIIASA